MGRPVTNRNDIDTVMRHVEIDPYTGCWLWTGSIQTLGYGTIEVSGRLWLAHRFSWTMHHKVEPTALMLHTCDVRRCVNPAHLFEGNHKNNHDDAVSKGRKDPMRVSRYSRKRRIVKLTDDAVRDIRSKLLSVRDYMRKYGIAQPTVSDIQRRKSKTLVLD